MSKSRVTGTSRVAIRAYARKIRKLLGFGSRDFIHAPKLFDKLSVFLDEQGLDFDYLVLPDNDKIFDNKEEAFTDMSTGMVYVKESVMEQACRRSFKRGAFTLAHELGHYLLHYLQNDVVLSRVSDDINVPIYCDPEWQADTFASEFLMPYEECVDMDEEEIRKTYHVSRRAAEVRYNKIQDELNK